MKILIIGGTRFMGAETARRLVAAGHSVTVFHRGSYPGDLPGPVTRIHGDRNRLDVHRDAVHALSPDVVLDMMLITDAQARQLVDTLDGLECRVVIASSQDVYRGYGVFIGTEPGEIEPVPFTESSPLRTRLYPYRGPEPRPDDDPSKIMDDYDKIPIENTVMTALPDRATVLRIPMVYGPGDYQHRFLPYVRPMLDQRPHIIMDERFARWTGPYQYVDNVVEAILAAVTNPAAAGRIYNIADTQAMTTLEWVRLFADIAGWTGRILMHLPDQREQDRTNFNQHFIGDSTRIRAELGVTDPVDLHTAVERTVAWEASVPADKIPAALVDYERDDALANEIKGD